MKELTSFSVIRMAGKDRISYTYTTIDTEGNAIESNKQENKYIIDKDLILDVNKVIEHIENKFLI